MRNDLLWNDLGKWLRVFGIKRYPASYACRNLADAFFIMQPFKVRGSKEAGFR